MSYTLTYSDYAKGWTSFYSFIPEAMNSIGNNFYSFKNGQVYRHNSTSSRNNFYGTDYNTEIETILSDAPSEVKIYKTLKLEGNTGEWDVTIDTNLASGHINKESFKTKEGMSEAYFRRNETDELNTAYISVQGIGSVDSVAGNVITFEGPVPSGVYVKNKLYASVSNTMTYIGVVEAIDGSTVTVDSLSYTPSNGDFCLSAKNPVVESNGIKGYYAKLRLTTSQTQNIELFAINADIVKSFS
jgi:hypothetical protein